jgi:hypothetical protein
MATACAERVVAIIVGEKGRAAKLSMIAVL